ncbi:MAG: biotin/lipoyl-binding protein, partial [Oscillospiraceae bacterium]|nr:biotin/lipoyl-binding protein [Oscillospiraceae bacterium]
DEFEAAALVAGSVSPPSEVDVSNMDVEKPVSVDISDKDKVIVAPLPGAVLDVIAAVGDTINNGDVVAIIEAMKMENEVISILSGKVKSVLVTKGNTVNTGDQLFILE